MPILHMETDLVRGTGQQLQQVADSLNQQTQQLNQTGQNLASVWQGSSSNAFSNEMMPLLNRLSQLVNDGTTLNQRLQREVDEWERVANHFGGLTAAESVMQTKSHGSTKIKSPLENFHGELLNSKKDGTLPDIPLYRFDMNNIYEPDILKFVEELDTGGRPVVFVAHGWTVEDESAKARYLEMVSKYEQDYADLPESQRPVFVGIDWNADKDRGLDLRDKFASYATANLSSEQTGKRFGELLDLYSQEHPDSEINVIAHSLGNKMVMEGIANSDAEINSYLAIQAAVGSEDISPNGKYAAILEQDRVNHLGITYAENDLAMIAHDVLAATDIKDELTGDNALGNSPFAIKDIVSSRSGKTHVFNLTNSDGEGITHHYSLDSQVVYDEAAVQFFGENGDGFSQVPHSTGGGGAW